MARDTKHEDLGSTKWVVATVLVGLVALVAVMLNSLWQDPMVFSEDLGKVVPLVYEQYEIVPVAPDVATNWVGPTKNLVRK